MLSAIRVAPRALPSFSRAFSVSAAARKDLVQDLYISQLKNYKPAPKSADASAGLVRNYTAPSPPKAPALPSDLAAELAKFDAQEPVIGQKAQASTSAAAAESEGENADQYLAFLEKDLPKADKHH